MDANVRRSKRRYKQIPPASPILGFRTSRLRSSLDPPELAHVLTLVEGAGGVLVSLGLGGFSVRDVAVKLSAPAILVVVSGLGTLNHSALSVESLVSAGVRFIGLVIGSWPQNSGLVEWVVATTSCRSPVCCCSARGRLGSTLWFPTIAWPVLHGVCRIEACRWWIAAKRSTSGTRYLLRSCSVESSMPSGVGRRGSSRRGILTELAAAVGRERRGRPRCSRHRRC